VGLLTPTRAVAAMVRAVEHPRVAEWAFNQYLAIAPPSFAQLDVHARARPRLAAAAA
jgi:hypothetical protein